MHECQHKSFILREKCIIEIIFRGMNNFGVNCIFTTMMNSYSDFFYENIIK